MMLSGEGSDRRCIMAMTVQQIHPVAHLPLVLGVLRRLAVGTVVDGLMPPHPAHVLSCGRGVEALVLAILDGDHALYKPMVLVSDKPSNGIGFYRPNSAIERGTKPEVLGWKPCHWTSRLN